MTNEQAIEIIRKEYLCVKRNENGWCDRKCENCDLVMPTEDIFETYKMAIKALEQKQTGHWIETDEWRDEINGFEQWGYYHKCSECGYVFKFLEIDNFCPNCGIRMGMSE